MSDSSTDNLSNSSSESVEQIENKCMNQNEKMEYLKKINNHYKYPNSTLEYMENPEYKICDGSELKKIKMFDDATVKSLIKLMEKTVDFLDDNGITYWMDSGTLLGACRNGKFVPWDDDVDLAIPYDSYIKIKQIIKTYPKVYVKGVKYRVCKKYDIKFTEIGTDSPLDKTKPFLLKTFHMDGIFDRDVFVDLMNYFPIENQTYVSNIAGWKYLFAYPFDCIYPLKKLEFEGRKYWSINDTDAFLNNTYWFWKDLAVASHAHFKHMKADRNKKIYFTLR